VDLIGSDKKNNTKNCINHVFGIFFLITCLGKLCEHDFIVGFLFLLTSILTISLEAMDLKRKLKTQISSVKRFFVVFLVMILAFIAISSTISMADVNNSPQTVVTQYQDNEWRNSVSQCMPVISADISNIKSCTDYGNLQSQGDYLLLHASSVYKESKKYNVSPNTQNVKTEYETGLLDSVLVGQFIITGVDKLYVGDSNGSTVDFESGKFYYNLSLSHIQNASINMDFTSNEISLPLIASSLTFTQAPTINLTNVSSLYQDTEWANSAVNKIKLLSNDKDNLASAISNNNLEDMQAFATIIQTDSISALELSQPYIVSPSLLPTEEKYEAALSCFNQAGYYAAVGAINLKNGSTEQGHQDVENAIYYTNLGNASLSDVTGLVFNLSTPTVFIIKGPYSITTAYSSPNSNTITVNANYELCIASSESNVYHSASCRYVAQIKQEHIKYFESRQEAEAAGYRACKVCGG
jgi:hypothetical protein